MYNPDPIVRNSVDTEQVYVQKLKNSIHEHYAIKEDAIRAENFALADQTKAKLSALQSQLIKMEHQLNADVLTNIFARWTTDLIDELSLIYNKTMDPEFATMGANYSASIKKVP